MQNQSFLFYTGAVAAILLPFAFEWLSPLYGLILVGIALLIQGEWYPNKWLLLASAAFLDWELISIWWSSFRSEGWQDVTMILPIVLMGIIVGSKSKKVEVKVYRNWALIFAYATVAAWSWTVAESLFKYGWVQYNDLELGGRLGIHYQSLYLLVAAFILEAHLRGVASKKYKLLHALLIVWLLFGCIMLSARIHLLLLPLFILVRTLDLLQGKIANKKKASLWAAGIIISMVTLMAVLPGTSRRLTDLKNEWRSIDGMVDGKQTNHRVYLWKYGWNVANESPIIGVGNGAGDELLHEALQSCDAVFYRKKEPYYLHEFKYDFHNILLQNFAEGGIVGVLLLLFLFTVGFLQSQGPWRYAWALFFFTGMTESLLERQAGVFLLAFLILQIQTRNSSTKPG
jgi:O-antigen ligase